MLLVDGMNMGALGIGYITPGGKIAGDIWQYFYFPWCR
jgi:hypothetical protein